MIKHTYYTNPVFAQSVPDPAVIRGQDGWFYCYGTPDLWEDGQVRQVSILKSKELVSWQPCGSVFETCPAWNGGTCLWAVEISWIEDRYVLYYTLIDSEGKPSIGVASADLPQGPFEDHGCLLTVEELHGVWAIDPTPVQDEQGRWYLVCGNYEQETCIVPLTGDGMHCSGEAVRLAAAYEGASILRYQGYYYLFGSLGTCTEELDSSYHVVVSRSRYLLGTYVNRAGEVVNAENKDERDRWVIAGADRESAKEPFFRGPGNSTWIQDGNGDIWLIYHAIDSRAVHLPDGEGTRRVLCMDRLLWDEDGWPYVEGGTPSTKPSAAPVF